jgi:hypothetical protein
MKSPGRTLLGIWVVAVSILPYLHLPISGLGLLVNLLGVVAGLLILIGR